MQKYRKTTKSSQEAYKARSLGKLEITYEMFFFSYRISLFQIQQI